MSFEFVFATSSSEIQPLAEFVKIVKTNNLTSD